MGPFALLLLLLTVVASCLARGGQGGDSYAPDIGRIHDARSLEAALYTTLEPNTGNAGGGGACVRWLHAKGRVGCGQEGSSPRDALLLVQESALHIPEVTNSVAIVVPAMDAGQLLTKLLMSQVERVGAVLIEYTESFPGWNSAQRSPLDEYRPEYRQIVGSHAWNPSGLGFNNASFPFAIFQLDNTTSPIARLRAQDNMNRLGQGLDPLKNNFHFVDIDVRMDADAAFTENSKDCIANSTCLPLGGSSVLAAFPPLRSSAPSSPDPKVILVVAQADAPPGLFHELAPGANAPLSGLIAVLAAARSLGRIRKESTQVSSSTSQIVFAALRGESLEFMASRRLLWESYGYSTPALPPFNTTPPPPLIFKEDTIDMLIEMGQVGTNDTHVKKLFAHTHESGPGMIRAMEKAASADKEYPVKLKVRSADQYGLPPSSSWSFLRMNNSIPTVVVNEFDKTFLDPTYASPYDSNISVKAVTAAALFLTRTLQILGGSMSLPSLQEADASTVAQDVAQLVDCFVLIGLEKCELAQQMMRLHRQPTNSHSLGVLRTVVRDPSVPDSTVQTDFERFLWNYLVLSTGKEMQQQKCTRGNASRACAPGGQCAGYKIAENGTVVAGTCMNSSVWYVPSYSTALECVGCDGNVTVNDFRWQVTDAAQEWAAKYAWPPDPLWTESNWQTGVPRVVMYLREAPWRAQRVLYAGVLLTGGSFIAVLAVKYAWLKRIKQD